MPKGVRSRVLVRCRLAITAMFQKLFIVIFGSAPAWVSALLVLYFSGQSNSTEYWSSAPWLVLFALPLCAATTSIALVTVGVYTLVKGSREKKFNASLLCFVALTGVALLLVERGVQEREEARVAAVNEENSALRFVSEHPAVLAVVGKSPRVWSGPLTVNRDGEIIEYEVCVESLRTVYAIVPVTRTSGTPVFSLRCMTTLPSGERQGGADKCSEDTIPVDAKGTK